jgi:hypothetical protein
MTNLMYLDLRSCRLSPAAGHELAETLKSDNKIIVLNLADNELGEDGINDILRVLLKNETLTELDISANHFKSCIAGTFIAENQVICSLNVSKNSIGDEGAISIGEALPHNTSLTRLSVASCRISDAGAIAIARSITKNTSLKNLGLNDNFLTRECGYELVDAIRANEIIRKVNLSATQIDNFVLKAMRDICERNIQIQKEIGLQPLKREVIQLSIQRTKMPEAISRLAALEKHRAELEHEVVDLIETIDSTQQSADANILQLHKAVQATIDQITEEKQSIEKLTGDREKSVKEYDDRYQEIIGNTEKEKVAMAKYTEDLSAVEQLIEENTAATNQATAELEEQLSQIREMIQQTREIANDPEALRVYEKPELPAFMEPPKNSFFLNDEILDLKDKEDSKKKKKGKKRKRSPSPKTARKKGAKSKSAPAAEAAAAAEAALPPQTDEEIPPPAEQTAPAPAAKPAKKRAKSAMVKKAATARKK